MSFNVIYRPDLRDHLLLKDQKPPSVGMESGVYQREGTNIFQWYVRKQVYWNPYGEPVVIDD